MKYEVEIFHSFGDLGGYNKVYGYSKWEDVLARIQKNDKNDRLLSIKEYHLVYTHPIYLPPPDRVDEFLKMDIYQSFIKTPKEQMVTAKQSLYKNNFIEDEDFSNYCLTYSCLDKDEIFGFIHPKYVTFDLNNNDRKAITHQLYQHSRSNSIFDLCLYQYRYIPISNFK